MLVVEPIAADPIWSALTTQLAAPDGVVHVAGVWGSCAPMIGAHCVQRSRRPVLYVTAHPDEADDARDDIELFSGQACELLPAWEALPGEGAGAGEIDAERIRLCNRLRDAARETTDSPLVLVAPVLAVLQPVPSIKALDKNTLRLSTGRGSPATTPDDVAAWVVDRGFERLDLVESPGDFARRGDIVDLFIPGDAHPVRVQFFDDRVESIRRFDIGTQRSIESLAELSITAMPGRTWIKQRETSGLLAYLPGSTVILLASPSEIQEMGRTLARRLGDADAVQPVEDFLRDASGFLQVHLSHFTAAATPSETVFNLEVTSLARFEGDAGRVPEELRELTQDHDVHVICDNEGERERLLELLATQPEPIGDRLTTHLGVMHHGFEWSRTRTVVVPHHDLFRRRRQRRQIRRVYAGKPLESWTELNPGEFVVHVSHGIAIYRGLKKMRKVEGGQQEEFLSLEFADQGVLHVPCSQVDLVQKYIGAAGYKPHLSKLGGKRWARMKEQVAESVSDLAERLLRLQAIRNDVVGTAYPRDTSWQREFENAFPYDETEDQLRVAGEIRDDLTGARPMDRLVCGDVGYGKTELAMRAAFKVVEYGRQVALLVPTTVLAEQHYETFKERFADYPFSIGCLSRFRDAAEIRKIVEQIRKGQVDIVIGTHRLLSKDVRFAELGLVIIDEEQRFGVEHKERLKAMRESVDVLTLTATPIPRTLHMSLIGVRDISSLQTPPMDRRAIATQVRHFDDKLIREAILREMNRDGQVYFIHNVVRTIASMADTVRRIVPEARVVYGHGQMADDELEEVMHKFLHKEADVLVATTIIESGIDIPSVNTIFINKAERFGLADLHQLRGRVGRSSHRAYCYLLVSPDQALTSKAVKRLKTIEEFSDLGAGFRIAMRDLEIRGAGNILGKEQSGNIAAVGYEMYCQLLEQTVRRMKNEPDTTPPPVHLDLDVTAHIPPHYIASERSRIEAYRRIVSCRTPEDLAQLERDLVDAFGPIPKQVATLMELAEIRVHARRFGILSISRRPPDVIFRVEMVASTEPLFADAPGSVRVPDANTIHLRLAPSYLEPTTLVPVLRRMFQRAAQAAVTTT